MTPFILIFDPSAKLELTPSRFVEWKHLAETGGRIIWNREGMIRVVLPEVIQNAIDDRHHVAAVFENTNELRPTYITWEQANAVDNRSGSPIRPSVASNNPPTHSGRLPEVHRVRPPLEADRVGHPTDDSA